MDVVRVPTPEEFLATTATYRESDALRTNILGTIPQSVASGLRAYDEYWWWVVREGDDVVGAALRTAPMALQIGPMPLEAVAALARAVAEHDDGLPSLVGWTSLVDTFLASHRESDSPGSRRVAVAGRRTLLYELADLVLPDVDGSLRRASADDLDLVLRWSSDFSAFVEGRPAHVSDAERAAFATRIKEGLVHLWCVDGEPVAMAVHSVPTGAPPSALTRIVLVFTPEDLRGRGYGSAVTGALSARLIATGSRVCLYTDADYPTSNAVYRRLGYRVVDEATQLDLTGAD